mgnify:CR=1 FL=1
MSVNLELNTIFKRSCFWGHLHIALRDLGLFAIEGINEKMRKAWSCKRQTIASAVSLYWN